MAKSKKKTKRLNDWNFWPALSNSRLSVHILHTPFKIRWSIDRITVVGELKTDYEERDLKYRHLLKSSFNTISEFLVGHGFAKEAGSNAYMLVDKYGENIAYFQLVKFHDNKARLDFNPSKLSGEIKSNLQTFIHRIFDQPHFSRFDAACDIFNIPNDFIRQYKLNDAVSYQAIYGRSGSLETKYFGSSASERQVRMYNKFVEQTYKKQYIIPEVETWWRIELQLRQSKASEWIEVVRDTLSSFCCLEFIPSEWSATDKIMLTGLQVDHHLWSELNRRTKYKYRKLLKEVAKNDELTQKMMEEFEKQKENVAIELQEWLHGMKIAEDVVEEE